VSTENIISIIGWCVVPLIGFTVHTAIGRISDKIEGVQKLFEVKQEEQEKHMTSTDKKVCELEDRIINIEHAKI
jgi:hypothetical protein